MSPSDRPRALVGGTPAEWGEPALAGLVRLVERYTPSVLDPADLPVRIRLVVDADAAWDVVCGPDAATIESFAIDTPPAATLTADRETWARIADDLRGGMDAYREGRLIVRHDLHLGVSFLAATSGIRGPGALVFRRAETASGSLSYLSAGVGKPVVLIHGLGATKVSFLPTVAALADTWQAISLDLPGFGDSVKPLGGAYDAPFFARAVLDLMDALGIPRAHLIGNSMGGRVALEIGMRHPDRAASVSLVAPSLAWRRQRAWTPLVRLFRPELGLIQATPRWAVEAVVRRLVPAATSGWVQAGVDEFLRAYLTPRGRVAFYAAARHIYIEEPHGSEGFWTRLATLVPPALFIWGRLDTLVPYAFAKHVAATIPEARQVTLDCGHVPQLERPAETHAAIMAFLAGVS